MAPRTTSQFSKNARAELAEALGRNDGIIDELQAHAGYYVQQSSSDRAAPARAAHRRDLKDAARIRAITEKLLRAIDASRPHIRLNANHARRENDRLARSSRGKGGAPADWRRWQLALAVGWTLHRHGITLTAGAGGALAKTLLVVLDAVGDKAPQVDSLKQVCRRVRDAVRKQATDVTEINALFDALEGGGN